MYERERGLGRPIKSFNRPRLTQDTQACTGTYSALWCCPTAILATSAEVDQLPPVSSILFINIICGDTLV